MDNNFYFFNFEPVTTAHSNLRLNASYRLANYKEYGIKWITAKLIEVMVDADLITLKFQPEYQDKSIMISMNVFSNEKTNWEIYDLE